MYITLLLSFDWSLGKMEVLSNYIILITVHVHDKYKRNSELNWIIRINNRMRYVHYAFTII